ncbi:MAG TPA: polysaccharide deacetylase family protein [Candidatus Choladousia intestinigallinarum]|nr:polysaccharide deacetylase family protein [Candidatus Choladousia intestinigallinarum]
MRTKFFHGAGLAALLILSVCLGAFLAEGKSVLRISGEEAFGQKKRVALTFDDGPHPSNTGLLLDGLRERNVKATFFLIGRNIPGNEAVVRRIYEEGHLIGNHTYDHVDLTSMGKEEACRQALETSRLVQEITGQGTEFIRAPFGAWNKELEACTGMIHVKWSVDPLDWTTENVTLITERVCETIEDGDIILLHDWYKSSVEAALQIVDTLLERGYEFVTVDQMILL